MLLTSALKSFFGLVLTLGRSLMYNRNRIGPRGTPHSILKKDDEVLFIDTN